LTIICFRSVELTVLLYTTAFQWTQ